MEFNEFLGKVQDRARLDSLDGALRATRATLGTLSERLEGNEPAQLAAQLPGELGRLLHTDRSGAGERFDADEFVQRVSRREAVQPREGSQHARVVLGVLSEAVSPGEFADVRQQLPPDYAPLLERTW
jgi:uncharacterized protein (DUF2267 family)